MSIKIVAMSDTHNKMHKSVPDGDVLVHAGDLTRCGRQKEIRRAAKWIGSLPHKIKLVIAGNHDFYLQQQHYLSKLIMSEHGITYLQDEGVEIDGKYFYGSPWQPTFGHMAFNLDRGSDIRKKWSIIPQNTDVLITHGPPHGIMDPGRDEAHVGCEDLSDVVRVVRPLLHIFGHCHQGYGQITKGPTKFVNAASCSEEGYSIANPPVELEI